MLTDFNDIWWECTCLYLQQTGVFFLLYGITNAQISWYLKRWSFLSNYVTRCKEEQLNKRIPHRRDISKDLSCKKFDEKLQNLIEVT